MSDPLQSSLFALGLPLFSITLFFLVGTFVLTAFSSALRRISSRYAKKELNSLSPFFFYRTAHRKLITGDEEEGIFFATLIALTLFRFFFFLSIALIIAAGSASWLNDLTFPTLYQAFVYFLWVVLTLLISDYLPRILGILSPRETYNYLAPIASVYLILAFPFTWLFRNVSRLFFKSAAFHKFHEPMAEAQQEIFDILQQSPLNEKLEPEDKKLIESVVDFREIIVREVMVPRVDLFALPAETTVKEAAKKIQEEGYSRIPIYKGSIDELLGILMYKDLLGAYMEASFKNNPALIEQSIESIVKPALFTPETKKISHLLQEFRKRQMHLAIVVDEYGGTEGIITIEDILESLVGEIEDEYDNEKDLYITLPDGSHIVDAKIGLLDLEELLDITLPEEGDFDTLGGYIFHKAGEIPKKGFKIKLDQIELEVLRASDRAIEKIKIRSR